MSKSQEALDYSLLARKANYFLRNLQLMTWIKRNGWGLLFMRLGKYDEAKQRFEESLHIWKQGLGPEHPQVAYARNNLAVLATKGKCFWARKRPGKLAVFPVVYSISTSWDKRRDGLCMRYNTAKICDEVFPLVQLFGHADGIDRFRILLDQEGRRVSTVG